VAIERSARIPERALELVLTVVGAAYPLSRTGGIGAGPTDQGDFFFVSINHSTCLCRIAALP
jgi:hypothetical protein